MSREFVPSKEALNCAGLSEEKLRNFEGNMGIPFSEYVQGKIGIAIATFASQKGACAQYEVIIRNNKGEFDPEFFARDSHRYNFLQDRKREAFINSVYDEFEKYVQENGFKIAQGELRRTKEGLVLYIDQERCPPLAPLSAKAPSRIIKFTPNLK